MSYVALYRKFRPNDFEDVKGQEHIVTTLKNEVKNSRIGHAYLFCGTRGTGKTTIAKILARAVNCENPKDGSPCNECPTCRAINEQRSFNVVEIDAASNNGVSNIRDIIEEVRYAPTEGKYRVYIIDEVHMLSNGAFNALLKTLEEPPSYVIFILATTEPHKIPITILSRCQRYDFKRISIQTISDRLLELTEKEGVSLNQDASDYIAKVADGSMRDALSLLDQCIAFYPNETLDMDKTLQVLGAVDQKVYEDLFRAMTAGKITECVNIINNLIDYGKELTQFVSEYIWHIRNILITKTINGDKNIVDASEETFEHIREEMNLCSADEMIRYIKVLSALSQEIRYSTQKRVAVEICFIRLCTPQMDAEQDLGNVKVRLSNVERKMEDALNGITVVSANAVANVTNPSGSSDDNNLSKEEEIKKKKELANALPEDIKELISRWAELMGRVGMPLSAFLDRESAVKTITPEKKLNLTFREAPKLNFFKREEEEKKRELEQAIEDMLGKHVDIVLTLDNTTKIDEDLAELSKYINQDLLVTSD
ncbi:MAG: DNA polymerase III subunit gamma/tau [Lachnospiraceae bacterium]|nr:DNA polymerase III subunit gamma/tau [Lachnospiraceae bacterium]